MPINLYDGGSLISGKINTTWNKISKPHGNFKGVWKPAKKVWVNKNGAWTLVYLKVQTLVLTAKSAVNLQNEISAHHLNKDLPIHIIINSGVNVGTVSTGVLTGLNATLINNGNILGTNSSNTALVLTSPLKLINNGWIKGAGDNGKAGAKGSTTTKKVEGRVVAGGVSYQTITFPRVGSSLTVGKMKFTLVSLRMNGTSYDYLLKYQYETYSTTTRVFVRKSTGRFTNGKGHFGHSFFLSIKLSRKNNTSLAFTISGDIGGYVTPIVKEGGVAGTAGRGRSYSYLTGSLAGGAGQPSKVAGGEKGTNGTNGGDWGHSGKAITGKSHIVTGSKIGHLLGVSV